jgi:hypothetical protein
VLFAYGKEARGGRSGTPIIPAIRFEILGWSDELSGSVSSNLHISRVWV